MTIPKQQKTIFAIIILYLVLFIIITSIDFQSQFLSIS